jgi:hypothetical protein
VTGRCVAIVGQLGEAAAEAEDFIVQFGLDPIVVGAGSGTFAEQLEALREASFAVLLLPEQDQTTGSLSPGILVQIGFLLGVLGRGRLCVLGSGKPPPVPELEGVLRQGVDDSGVWRLLLAREMKRAGLEIDLNRAL